MDRVADTSIIIAVITNEPQKAALISQTQGATLYAPSSLTYEIGNAFSAMLKRGRISLEQAQAAVSVYHKIAISLVDVDLAEGIELANRLQVYAYDAYMIACARQLQVPLLTLDGGLKAAAKIAGVIVEELLNADLS